MNEFLLYIGIYNTTGAALFFLLHNVTLADNLLRKWTEIITFPFQHNEHSRIWIHWAASANLFLGLIMLLSTRWPMHIQKEVIICVIMVYAIMHILLLFGIRNNKFGRGIWYTIFLWIAQILWGILVIT